MYAHGRCGRARRISGHGRVESTSFFMSLYIIKNRGYTEGGNNRIIDMYPNLAILKIIIIIKSGGHKGNIKHERNKHKEKGMVEEINEREVHAVKIGFVGVTPNTTLAGKYYSGSRRFVRLELISFLTDIVSMKDYFCFKSIYSSLPLNISVTPGELFLGLPL